MMDSYQIKEILVEQRRRALDAINPIHLEARQAVRHHDGWRRAIAAALVRLGMTLDREAGARAVLAR